MAVIGIDIGGTHFRIGSVDASLQVSHFQRIPVREVFHSSDALTDLSDYLTSYIHRTGIHPEAIAMGFPATVDRERTTVLQAPNLPFMERLPIRQVLSQRLGVPILLERDANLALYYDRMQYGLQESDVLIGIYFGTGIGNAVMIHQQLLVGRNGTAGELGHIPVAGSALVCGCGNVGCMENLAGGKYLAQLQQTHFPDVPIGAVFSLRGDSPLVSQMIRYMAMTIATEVNILDPDCVVIGGGIPAMEGFPWDALVEQTLLHTRKPYPANSLRLIRTVDSPEKGVIGAALYAKEQLKL